MGVDLRAFARSRPLPCGRTILAVGRLVEKKGFGVLVEAAAKVGGARVQIVGDGPLRGVLELQIATLRAPVDLLGSRPHSEVIAAMMDADVLAMPCIVAADGDRDTMPVVVKEAMALELLVVASDEVGLPECVLEPWGYLARPGNAAALAAALQAALDLAPQQRLAAGKAAREWVREHADVDRETARMAAIIEEIVSSPGG
jgi:glycosyltransferase involved in cell wall biosynthesis